MLVIVVVVLVANVPYLLSITDPNPLGPRSGLATNGAGLVHGANTLDPTDGYITQALGHLAATDLLHGHLPSWDPYQGPGLPLMADAQSAALFPPTLLLALHNGQFYEQLLLEIVAGLSAFLVLRRIGVGHIASGAGGAAFALNGAFAWLATTSFNTVAFLPLLVLGVEYAYTAGVSGRRGGWWLISVALALSLYAGFPETAYINALLAAVWFAWRCGCAGRNHLRVLLIKGAAGAAVGLLLAAPAIVPFVAVLSHEYVGIHSGTAGSMTMPAFAWPQLLLPYVYGPPLAFTDRGGALAGVWGYAGGFITVSLLFLAAVSFLSARQRGLKLLLAGFTVITLAKVYGQPPLLRHVLLLLPGGTSVAFYRYSFPAIAFGLCVMAALAIDQLGSAPPRRAPVAVVAATTLALMAGAAFEAHRLVVRLDGGSGHSHWAWAQIAIATLTTVSIAAVLMWRGRWRAPALATILVVDVALMFVVHELPAPTNVRVDASPVSYLRTHLGDGRFFTLGPLAPNYGAYWRIASLNDLDVPLPKAWTEYLNQHLDGYVNPVFFVGNDGGGRSPSAPSPEHELLAHLAAYREAGVRYVVTEPGEPLRRSDGFTLAFRGSTAWIYHLTGSGAYFSTGSACSTRGRGRGRVSLSCPQATTLVRHELAFPGWSAHVDGRSVPIRTTAGIYQGVTVPAGSHEVSFDYSPPGFGWALVGALVGVIWLAVGTLGSRRRQPWVTKFTRSAV